jgi:hypothetical protein
MGKCEFEDHAGEAVGSGEEPKGFEESIRAVGEIDRSIAAAEERLANLTAQRDSAVMFVLQEAATIAEDLDRRLKVLESIGNAAVNASVSQIRARLGNPSHTSEGFSSEEVYH